MGIEIKDQNQEVISEKEVDIREEQVPDLEAIEVDIREEQVPDLDLDPEAITDQKAGINKDITQEGIEIKVQNQAIEEVGNDIDHQNHDFIVC